MLDPVREKCDLHIRAPGIFVMQLELLEIQRLVTLSHNEGPIVAEEPILATAQLMGAGAAIVILNVAFWGASPFVRERGRVRVNLQQSTVGSDPSRTSFIPKLDGFRVCRRTKG